MIVLNSIMIHWRNTLLEFIIKINNAKSKIINKLCLKFMKKISNSVKNYTLIFYQNISFNLDIINFINF